MILIFSKAGPAELTAGPYPLCPVILTWYNTYFCFNSEKQTNTSIIEIFWHILFPAFQYNSFLACIWKMCVLKTRGKPIRNKSGERMSIVS